MLKCALSKSRGRVPLTVSKDISIEKDILVG